MSTTSQSPKGCYYVSLTYFNDDYKPRGGPEIRGPYFFATRAIAEKFLVRVWHEFLFETGYEHEENPDDWERDEKGQWVLKCEYDLEDIVAEQAEGQYVETRFTWHLGYRKINETEDADSCDDDSPGEEEEDEEEEEPAAKRTKTEEDNETVKANE